MKLCLGCMEQVPEGTVVCPHCGFDEQNYEQESYYLEPGAILGGKYVVGRELKYGGYTVTYIGLDAEKNQKVFIKEYLPSEFSTRSAGESEVTIYSGDALEQFNQGLITFLNEANRIQHLDNPQGIARVYDSVAENDTGYVISEYLEGRTLQQIMETKGKFTWQEAKGLVTQILTGLSLVHPLDIIHCDISPETILVTDQGEVKLLDFGATRYVTTANSSSLAIILKQGFAPEEQYRSQGIRGPWTDVYALAAVMYYMLTGTVPIESVDRALLDELQEPSKLGVELPQSGENALMNALNVYQKDRTKSAKDFLDELNREDVKRVQVKSKRRKTGKFPAWAKVLVAGLAVAVAAGGVTVVHMQTNRQEQQSEMGQGGQTVLYMPSIIKMTEEDAQEYFNKKQYKDLGVTLQKDNDFYYTNDTESIGKIAWQSIEIKTELKKNDKVVYKLGDNTRIHYSDIGLYKNAQQLGELLKATNQNIKYIEIKDNSAKGKPYGGLAKIVCKDQRVVTESQISQDKTAVLNVAQIESIAYYARAFFAEDKLTNKVGYPISSVEMHLYEKKNGKRQLSSEEKQAVSVADAGFVDASYYTFKTAQKNGMYKPGNIIEQTKKSGEFDETVNPGEILFKVIAPDGNVSGKIGSSLKQIKEWIRNKIGNQCKLTIRGSENEAALVQQVTVKLNEKEVAAFRPGDDEKLEFILTTQMPTPTPRVTAAPTAAPQITAAPKNNSSSGSQSKSNEKKEKYAGKQSGSKMLN